VEVAVISKGKLARTARIARRSSLLALLVGASQAFGLQSAYAAKISSNYGTTCQVLENSHIKCWGAGKAGQLGDGKTESSATPVEVEKITNATSVSVGHESACATLANGHVDCWGLNAHGQLGNSSASTESKTPVEVEGITTATEVSVGYESACATLANGHVDCWGLNAHGQLGDNTTTNSTKPVEVEGIIRPTSVSVGHESACATIEGGKVECWGANEKGQLGTGTTTNSTKPVEVQGITTATQVLVGYEFACALLGNQTVACWGDNYWGSLGNGSTINSKTPVAVKNVTGASELAAGYGSACAALEDRHVDCWGYNYEGQLGYEFIQSSSTPLEVQNLPAASAVTAGGESACALSGAGGVWCWGIDAYGALGAGTEDQISNLPLAVSGLAGATDVSVGYYSACATLSTDHVECWGYNEFGQLGNGTTTSSPVPVEVKNIANATQVSVGYLSACATLSTGQVDCWGYNGFGQLGNSSASTKSKTPVEVEGITTATQVSVGYLSACATLSTGHVECWGRNEIGQLGNGKTEPSSVPVEVKGISTATSVSAGTNFACATLSTGRIECWGANNNGQLGIAGNPLSALALNVSGLLPFATTAPATSIGPDSATLNATVNPEGVSVNACSFEYGTTPAYGSSIPCAQALGAGTTTVPASATPTSLAPSTTYHYRVVIQSADGPVYGQDQAFTTAQEPPKPPTPPTTTTAPSQGNAKAELLSHRAKSNPKGRVALVLSCPAGSNPCAGKVLLRLVVRLRHARKHKRRRRLITLATATYHLKPRSKARVMLKLSRLARRLLAKHHRLRVTAALVEKIQNRTVITTRKVTIIRAKAKRRGVRHRRRRTT
jgi:alpha-tubulin suppressor-like RCC1 family protein